MAKIAVLRYAQERGHTVITERIVIEATESLCPVYHEAEPSRQTITRESFSVSAEVSKRLEVVDPAERETIMLRAQKKARQEDANEIGIAHVAAFVGEGFWGARPNRQ